MKPLESLEARAAAMRTRIRLRAWELRQIHRAKGSWHRLKLILARTKEVYAIDDATLQALLSEGYSRETVGDELEPRRNYVFVTADRAASIAIKRPLTIRLSTEFLASSNIILVPFEDCAREAP